MSAYATSTPDVMDSSGTYSPPPSTKPNGLTRDEVMTAREVSDLLKMPVSTVYELARRGEIPARRLERTWRFLRPRLEELLAA
jgi:excisionase family DNA binding protein